mgnify:CR=1 FL=1
MHNGKPNPSIARKDWDECIELSSKDSSWWFRQSNSRNLTEIQRTFMLMVWIWTKQSDGWHLNEVQRIRVNGFEMDQANLMVDIEWSSKDLSWRFQNRSSKSDVWTKFKGFKLMVSIQTKQLLNGNVLFE